MRRSHLFVALSVGAMVLVAGIGTAGAESTHRVERGETLSGIASRHGTTVRALAQANGLSNPDFVMAGKVLTIPSGGGAAAPGGTGTAYVIRPGDTLSGIAARHGTTALAIAQANGITNLDRIRHGTTILVPAAGTGANRAAGAPGSASASALPTGGKPGTELVRSGDTLAAIAARTGVPADVIAAANGLQPPFRIYTGGQLLLQVRNFAVPAPLHACPVPGATYMNDWGFGRVTTGFHEGTDLFAPRGTPVVAPAPGSAATAVGAIGGNQVRLAGDDGTSYVFSHLDAFGHTGRVGAGDVIGYVGNTGDARGGPFHLHFGMYPANGAAVNPYPLVRNVC